MTDQETTLANAFATTLTAEMGPVDLTAAVVSIGTLTTPCILVIDMEDDAKREYILFDGTFGATSFVTTSNTRPQRYLAGSAAASNITHALGANVQSVATQQHFEDLNDRIDVNDAVLAALDHGDDLAGLDGDDHTQYHTDARGDARYALVASARFVLVWSAGKGECETGVKAEAFRWKAPFACTLVSATPTAGLAPTGDSIDFEVEKGGTTMFSTKPTIAAAAQDGVKQTPSVTAIASAAVVTAYITQVGSTTPGENVALALEITVP